MLLTICFLLTPQCLHPPLTQYLLAPSSVHTGSIRTHPSSFLIPAFYLPFIHIPSSTHPHNILVGIYIRVLDCQGPYYATVSGFQDPGFEDPLSLHKGFPRRGQEPPTPPPSLWRLAFPKFPTASW
jgi:hypothetical protein